MPVGVFHIFADRLECDGFFPMISVQVLGNIPDAAQRGDLGAGSEIAPLHVSVDARLDSRSGSSETGKSRKSAMGAPASTW